MTERLVALVKPDGMFGGQTMVQVGRTAAEEGTNPNGWLEVDSDVELEHWHRYDRTAGTWSVDGAERAAAIDRAYRADNGPLAIELAHMRKEFEARMIAAGMDLSAGRLAAEAQATGQDLQKLAATVLQRVEAAPDPEVQRIVDKVEAVASDPATVVTVPIDDDASQPKLPPQLPGGAAPAKP